MAMTRSICFLPKQNRLWIMFLPYHWIIFTVEASRWNLHMNSLCRLLHSNFKPVNPSVELRFLSPSVELRFLSLSVEDLRSMLLKCRKERKLTYAFRKRSLLFQKILQKNLSVLDNIFLSEFRSSMMLNKCWT